MRAPFDSGLDSPETCVARLRRTHCLRTESRRWGSANRFIVTTARAFLGTRVARFPQNLGDRSCYVIERATLS